MVTLEDLKRLLREELTSGDPYTVKKLSDLILSIILKDSLGNELSSYIKNLDTKLSDFKTVSLSTILKDSTGIELSSYVKNLDVLLSTRASESTLTAIKSKTDNLDVLLSTRASESTLTAIKTKTDNLDVLLSTRASEATLSAIKNALASVGTDKIRVSPVDPLPLSPINLTQISGTSLTARDWSSDFAKLQNLDIALSAHRDAILAKLDEIGKLVLIGYTTTPLAANASWVSAVDSDPIAGRIVGSVYADQAGTLYVEQSPDNNNWDVVDSFSVSAGSGLGFSVEKVCPYARARYVNGVTAQTVFRLYVYKRLRVI